MRLLINGFHIVQNLKRAIDNVVEVIVLAMALSMDAFAVSIVLGTKQAKRKLSLGLMAGLYFDMFQGICTNWLCCKLPLYCLFWLARIGWR